MLYYISKNETNKLQEMYSYIQCYFSTEDNNITITNLRSNMSGKEYATHLIIYICKKANNQHIEYVTLDDCSNRYRDKNNIYIKLGFTYIDSYGPEMISDVKTICKYTTNTTCPKVSKYSLF